MDEIVEAVKNADKITVFTGAGTSVESGIAPFRGEDGLWDDFDPQKVASASAFADGPERCWKLFKLQIEESFDAEPHEGHYSLVELEDHGLKSIITQNIDGLHQRAGSKNVLEIHGSLNKLICPSCQKKYDTRDFLDEIKDDRIPTCKCDSFLRPNVVLFGEKLPRNLLDRSWHEVRSCDLLFTLGTSAVVQPAASLPSAAKKAGAEVVEINLEKTPLTDKISDYFLKGKVGEELPKLTACL
ncbi:MAG: NAD-dependent deacylase [Candidatus Thermoplasmatota archaeon]|nr:NAD-dependent deacylase [Candidatus Thermoplasmatota archaeon]MBS3789320.1 NAD-dependent deacylase [Candidatus Thermoplasmatota archaeon]